MADEIPKGFKPVDDAPAGFTAAKAPYSDSYSPAVGGALDTFGLTDRPGKRTTADVLLRPEGGLERVAQGLTAAGAIGATGGLAASIGLPAMLGEIGAGAGIGAAQSLARGESGPRIAWDAMIDGLLTGATGGLTKLLASGGTIPLTNIGVGLKEWGAPARAFKWASEAPQKALDLILSRVPRGARVLNVPSISPKPLSPEGAVKQLAEMTGKEYQIARAELASELTKWDAQIAAGGPRPGAGQIFKKYTAKDRYEPSALSRVAETVRKGVASPVTRAGAAGAALSPLPPDPEFGSLPAGVVPFGAVADRILSHSPAGKMISGEERER